MKKTLYLYSQSSLFKIIEEILFDHRVVSLTIDEANKHDFKNNNVLFVLREDITNQIKKSFFSNNNAVIFFANSQDFYKQKMLHNANFFYGHSSVKKFLDEIKISFIFKILVLKNIEIVGEKITNINSGENLLLTSLEKEILIVLLENKKIKRDYLLEEILKIKKNIETKTIESHLTRIRRKLLRIKSEIQIFSKEDVIYLDS